MPCSPVEMNFYWITWHHIPEDCTLQRNCSFDERSVYKEGVRQKREKNHSIRSDHLARLLEQHNLLEKIVTNHIL
jgi:hypothetical protein